jgi:hypothetical protein
MTIDKKRRDRVAYLRQLAVDSLKNYRGGFTELQRIDQDLDSIIVSLEDIADPAWTSSLLRKWSRLEIIYALRLADGRHSLTEEEETTVEGIVAGLLAELQDYQLPLTPEDKPEEGDTIRLRRSLPEHGLPAGSTGRIVVDYAKYSGSDGPLEYEVEFADPNGATELFATLAVDDVELVSRPGYSRSVSQRTLPERTRDTSRIR